MVEPKSEKTVNLTTKTITLFLSTATAIFFAGAFLFVTHETAKEAKTMAVKNDTALRESNRLFDMRMDIIENKAARFEGIMEERTQSIMLNVEKINRNVQTLLDTMEYVPND